LAGSRSWAGVTTSWPPGSPPCKHSWPAKRGEDVNDERSDLGKKFRVGVFVLVSLVAGVGMVYALGARARLFESRYTVHADFTEVGGLNEGATVRLAGVQIGRVKRVNLPAEPGGKVRVD